MSAMMLFTGNANPKLAEDVSKQLTVPLGQAKVGSFSDGETMVELLENVRGRDIYLLQSTCPPTNHYVMELMVMADAFRRASAGIITAVIPYFGYARQDRRVRSARVAITAKVIADMLAGVGIDRMLTVDLHADQIQGFFSIPVDNIYASPIIIDDIKNKYSQDHIDKVQVVSPDVGGVMRARAIAKQLNDADLVIIDKRRTGPNRSKVMNVIGDPSGRDCIIVDDIVDTAGTLCSAATKLKEHGATTVTAYITHPVLSCPAIDNINQSCLDELVVTNTIPLSPSAQQSGKIRQLNLAPIIAQVIQRINTEESVSSMFADEHV